jgi:hypothetical protein
MQNPRQFSQNVLLLLRYRMASFQRAIKVATANQVKRSKPHPEEAHLRRLEG